MRTAAPVALALPSVSSVAGRPFVNTVLRALPLFFSLTLAAIAPPLVQAAPQEYQPGLHPEFPGQTNAPAPQKSADFNVEVIVQGTEKLNHPWSLALLPDGKMLVTERNGTMRTVRMDGVFSAPLGGVPDVKSAGADGLHDIALDPHFAQNRLIYITYFAPPPGEDPGVWPSKYIDDVLPKEAPDRPLAERRRIPVGTERMARARLSEDDKRLENVQILVEGVERRVVFGADGTLYVAGADRYLHYDSKVGGPDREITDPDILRNFTGRVSRVNVDGSYPADNPFLGVATVLPDTFAYGLRDPEGLAINPVTGDPWLVDHGPLGGDELNIIHAGRNYGWPNVSYGRQYNGKPVARNSKGQQGATAAAGTEQPVYYWNADVAPSGLMFYSGNLFPQWKGNLFVGALAAKCLIRLVLQGNSVVAEERLLLDRQQRIRDVRQAADGAVFVLTDDGMVLRLTPKS